jgi:hypothetical protein
MVSCVCSACQSQDREPASKLFDTLEISEFSAKVTNPLTTSSLYATLFPKKQKVNVTLDFFSMVRERFVRLARQRSTKATFEEVCLTMLLLSAFTP